MLSQKPNTPEQNKLLLQNEMIYIEDRIRNGKCKEHYERELNKLKTIYKKRYGEDYECYF